MHQKPLGKMKMDGGTLEEADMEHCFTNAPPDQNTYICRYLYRFENKIKSKIKSKSKMFNPGHQSVEDALYE